MKNQLLKNVIIFTAVCLFFGGVFSLYDVSGTKPEQIDLQKMVNEINAGQIKSIIVNGDILKLETIDDKKQVVQKETQDSLPSLISDLGISSDKLQNIALSVEPASGFSYWLSSLLPFLIPILILVVMAWFFLRQVQGANSKAMSFGQSTARQSQQKGGNRITFKDVAGVKEAKEELHEVVEFLQNPKKFTSLGAKIPKGVLLMGSPGTGKTLLAKAVAGEANVPFFSISGSEFVEMFVGVGASRVRDLFKKAKKSSPCIVFIDEIDAVGRQRGAGLGGSHDEREQTLNQILVEMDGFEATVNVIVIAATNRPDVLDPALLRPGRFDRRVVLELPDIADREEILTVHKDKKPLENEVNIRQIAERTPGFSGADLANLFNEAAILAARRNKKRIGQMELIESIEKVMLGPEKKSHVLSEKEKRVTAIHEAGHALVAHLLPNADPVHKVSVISRGNAAGYTLKLPIEDKYLHKKSEFVDDLAVLLAGHVAEKSEYGEVTTGASSDLRVATNLARSLITQYGMSEKLMPRVYGEKESLVFLGRDIKEQRNYSERVAEQIDEEIDAFILQAVNTAQKLITDNSQKMNSLVHVLMSKETIEKDEFEALMAGAEPQSILDKALSQKKVESDKKTVKEKI